VNELMTKKLIAVFSSVLIFAGSVAPVFAESSIQITGNGSGSENVTNVSVTQTTQVSQTNSANINNNVQSSANSGGNTTSHNTGGDVTVDTGNAKSQVTVANTANSNVASVDNCNCGSDVNVKVSGNGDHSENAVNTKFENTVQLGQANQASINNDVRSDAKSGDNGASHNTGGSVKIMTGNATSNTNLSTAANQNIAMIGGGNGSNGSVASVIISGNGSGSDNVVNLGLTDWVTLAQANSADVDNDVNAKATTGGNDAKYNTGGSDVFGGDVTIDTGNATTGVTADTAVNFNEASVGCDCLMDVTAKIDGNGASGYHWWDETNNVINASLTNGQVIGQANGGEGIDNDLNGYSKTGYNEAQSNTAESSDPSISTGDATSTTNVENTGNANILGDIADFPFPWTGTNTNVSLTFSLHDLLIALGIH
jgi:hypothetical protein